MDVPTTKLPFKHLIFASNFLNFFHAKNLDFRYLPALFFPPKSIVQLYEQINKVLGRILLRYKFIMRSTFYINP